MALTADAIRAMLAVDEETGLVEFKIQAPRPNELAERICGMANSRTGGTILFGIDDSSRRAVGLDKPHATIDRIWMALRLVKPSVPLLDEGPLLGTVDGAQLVALRIAPNGGELYQSSNVFWIRKGSQTIGMTKDEIAARLLTFGTLAWERRVCGRATLDDLDLQLVERYLAFRAERSRQRLRMLTPAELLLSLECAAPHPTTQAIQPTNLGMLLFGLDPQLFLPHSEVVCIRYGDDLGAGQYVDRKNYTGTVTALIDQAANFLLQHMNIGAQITGFKREDLLDYPREALREAVTNAVVHRDYSLADQNIRIFMYPTRIEVHSPGLLVPGLTLEELRSLSAPSRPRNYLLASYLRDIPGYMERVGSGIRLMTQEMRQHGLPAPEFREQHEFVVLFRGGQGPGVAGMSGLNPRQEIGLRLVQQHGSISNGEYTAATGANERTALRDLRDLTDRGILVRRGSKRSARYYLP